MICIADGLISEKEYSFLQEMPRYRQTDNPTPSLSALTVMIIRIGQSRCIRCEQVQTYQVSAEGNRNPSRIRTSLLNSLQRQTCSCFDAGGNTELLAAADPHTRCWAGILTLFPQTQQKV